MINIPQWQIEHLFLLTIFTEHLFILHFICKAVFFVMCLLKYFGTVGPSVIVSLSFILSGMCFTPDEILFWPLAFLVQGWQRPSICLFTPQMAEIGLSQAETGRGAQNSMLILCMHVSGPSTLAIFCFPTHGNRELDQKWTAKDQADTPCHYNCLLNWLCHNSSLCS